MISEENQNFGFKHHRTKLKGNELEKAFSDFWANQNKRYNDSDLIVQLLTKNRTPHYKKNVLYFDVGNEHRKAAATLFQWLGSPVGFSYLKQILRENGIEVVE